MITVAHDSALIHSELADEPLYLKGDTSSFPDAPFYLRISDPADDTIFELVRVLSRAGQAGTGYRVQRGQRGTAATRLIRQGWNVTLVAGPTVQPPAPRTPITLVGATGPSGTPGTAGVTGAGGPSGSAGITTAEGVITAADIAALTPEVDDSNGIGWWRLPLNFEIGSEGAACVWFAVTVLTAFDGVAWFPTLAVDATPVESLIGLQFLSDSFAQIGVVTQGQGAARMNPACSSGNPNLLIGPGSLQLAFQDGTIPGTPPTVGHAKYSFGYVLL